MATPDRNRHEDRGPVGDWRTVEQVLQHRSKHGRGDDDEHDDADAEVVAERARRRSVRTGLVDQLGTRHGLDSAENGETMPPGVEESK
jgi:hypothetical protein